MPILQQQIDSSGAGAAGGSGQPESGQLRLCRRELEILEIIKEHEAKGTDDPFLEAIAFKLNISIDSACRWVAILMRKRALPVEDERKFPPLKYGLSPKQSEILRFIKQYVDAHKFAPSMADIADGLGVRNRMSIKQHLDVLRVKGYVDFIDGKKRSLHLTAVGDAACGTTDGAA